MNVWHGDDNDDNDDDDVSGDGNGDGHRISGAKKRNREKDWVWDKKNNGYFKWDFAAMSLLTIDEYSSTRISNVSVLVCVCVCVCVKPYLNLCTRNTETENYRFVSSSATLSSRFWNFQADFDQMKSDFSQKKMRQPTLR